MAESQWEEIVTEFKVRYAQLPLGAGTAAIL